MPTSNAQYQPGDHACCLFDTEEERRSLVTPYIRQGLEKNEKVVYLVDGPTAAPLLAYLRSDGVDVNGYLKSNRLTIVSATETCAPLGYLDPKPMVGWLRQQEEEARRAGFTALRCAIEMTWALGGVAEAERVVDFEWKVNAFFPGRACIALCQYDRRRFDESTLGEIVVTHPMVLCGVRGYNDLVVHRPPAPKPAWEPAAIYDPESDPMIPKVGT
jgi:hypothetical protein